MALAVGFLLIPAATAQDVESGCIEASPCEWIVEIDDDGFDAGLVDLNGTSGDWYILDVFNFGDNAHTVRLDGHGIELSVPSVDSRQSSAFQLGAAGTYSLMHAATDDVVLVTVEAADSLSEESSDGNKSTPGTAIPATLGALAIAAFRLRR